jgi:hypothetical protein
LSIPPLAYTFLPGAVAANMRSLTSFGALYRGISHTKDSCRGIVIKRQENDDHSAKCSWPTYWSVSLKTRTACTLRQEVVRLTRTLPSNGAHEASTRTSDAPADELRTSCVHCSQYRLFWEAKVSPKQVGNNVKAGVMTFVELELSRPSCEASFNRAMLHSAEACRETHDLDLIYM